MSWSDDRVDTLKRLWPDGQSASEIAKHLGGVSRNAVIGKVRRLGLSARGRPSAPGAPRPPKPPKPHAVSQRRKPPAGAGGFNYRTSSTPKPPVFVVPETAADGALTTLQLVTGRCRFPVGSASGADQLFCGAAAEGRYCAHHRTVVYRPDSEQQQKASARLGAWLADGAPRRRAA